MGLSRADTGALLAVPGPAPLLQLSVLKDVIPRVYAARLLGFSRAMMREILEAGVPFFSRPVEEWLRPYVLTIQERIADGDRTLAVQIVHQCPTLLNKERNEILAVVNSL